MFSRRRRRRHRRCHRPCRRSRDRAVRRDDFDGLLLLTIIRTTIALVCEWRFWWRVVRQSLSADVGGVVVPCRRRPRCRPRVHRGGGRGKTRVGGAREVVALLTR